MFDPQNPPELEASTWLNAPEPRPLESLKGRVVVLTAFQTHCPGSLKHGLPQAERVAQGFSDDEVVVIGAKHGLRRARDADRGQARRLSPPSRGSRSRSPRMPPTAGCRHNDGGL